MFRGGNEGMSTIPGLNRIQFEGFCRFIDQGLTKELYKFPKMEDTYQEIEFQLFLETYQLVKPLIKERDVVYESLTYSSELFVSIGLIWKTSRNMLEQTIFIGNIPLMNSLGTSIVNGLYQCDTPNPRGHFCTNICIFSFHFHITYTNIIKVLFTKGT